MAGGAPIGFLAALGADTAAELRVRCGPRSFGRGDPLMHVGQVPRDVFFLTAGRVKVSTTTTAGRTVLLAFRGPGDMVGDLAALDDEPRSASVLALEPVQALAIGREEFRAFLLERPHAALVMLRELSSRLRDADAKRIQLAAYTTVGRVAFCLLELSERFGEDGEIALPLTQEELASWAGASIESVGRALQTMRKLKWIETGRRTIRVLDRSGLVGATA